MSAPTNLPKDDNLESPCAGSGQTPQTCTCHPDTDEHRAGCTHCQYIHDSKLPGSPDLIQQELIACLDALLDVAPFARDDYERELHLRCEEAIRKAKLSAVQR